MVAKYGKLMDVQPEGYAIDKTHPDLIYLPLDLRMRMSDQSIRWEKNGKERMIKLQPNKLYMQPNGYKIEMQKHPGAPSWRLIGADAEGVFCHKPCTVSGGGKSEISKSIDDAVIYGDVFVQNYEKDLNQVAAIFDKDYTDRLKPKYADEDRDASRKPLSEDRSLGSVIKLLIPSASNTDEYNTWLKSIPPRILSLVFIIKRMHTPEIGDNWRRHFSVDVINGVSGHSLKKDGRKLVASYLRVGLDEGGIWHTYKVRQDFIATAKVQMEDDISASVVVDSSILPNTSPKSSNSSVKLVKNCEYRLFQRPDEAVHRGFDTQTEIDMSQDGNFIANFEPLIGEALEEIVEDVVEFQKYTDPMRNLLQGAYDKSDQYVVSSANPRMINGEPSTNPRYLQLRPDLQDRMQTYAAQMGARLRRGLAIDEPVVQPVNAVLTGRRNNPPGEGIRPLAVYNPIHYQELPELFMDFICSVTGKSPSTTGAGSEGALTKGPFNALRATADLNSTLVSFIISDYDGFSRAAGYIGPNLRVDHDISLLIPEIWARLDEDDRDAHKLIEKGCLEAIEDFEYEGKMVLGSRLGYRITDRFVSDFMGKIFDNPSVVFDDAILKPETQSLAVFADGINNIVEAQQGVAQNYLDDGSIEDACPPLRALLTIMATGEYEGKDVHHPEIRALFTREAMLKSQWYRRRLETKQERDIELWKRHNDYLATFMEKEGYEDVAVVLDIQNRLETSRKMLESVQSPDYLDSLKGTIGADTLEACIS